MAYQHLVPAVRKIDPAVTEKNESWAVRKTPPVKGPVARQRGLTHFDRLKLKKLRDRIVARPEELTPPYHRNTYDDSDDDDEEDEETEVEEPKAVPPIDDPPIHPVRAAAAPPPPQDPQLIEVEEIQDPSPPLFARQQQAFYASPPLQPPPPFQHAPPPPPQHHPLPLQKHEYKPNGLLSVNPSGPHPIFELIQKGQEAWEAKLRRASTTLEGAVKEYRRRYGRYPPKGFDAWWEYVERNNVQLPDEYDQIYTDLEPFWGINPSDLNTLATAWENHKDTYVLGKSSPSSPVAVLKTSFNDDGQSEFLLGGANDLIRVLEEVQERLPEFRIVGSPHDNPNLVKNWELMRKAVEAASAGTYIDISEPAPASSVGWLSACPPNSPARRSPSKLYVHRPTSPHKTFIHNHALTMDPCLHPTHFHLHGQFISHKLGPYPEGTLFPQFSYCRTELHYDMSVPTPGNWVDGEEYVEWEEKDEERLLWRGSNTGIWHGGDHDWWASHRERLVEATNDKLGSVKVLRSPGEEEGNWTRVGEEVELKKKWVNPGLMDVGFAGEPISCEPAICEVLKELFEWKGKMSVKAAGRYKYVMDVDGNGWSSRYKRLITSNSLIFKSTIYREWFQDRVQPWVHYVPIQIDFSDLYDSLIFFRGDLNGVGAHDELAKKIAGAGREWSRSFWRREDLTAYMYRLVLEYARVMSLDREEMTWYPEGL
ncbi:glycosyltransferase family 90 protein [Jaapia argillacea MUCL 33604]|uniref:Glycosyltransferase family 90 protein n=1 Tax=Jaapia argillacea MUCL 33604 TaxID=933084 RepID=A0A067PK03_9AGAM|nr:glycosyltransferase family 90 protein [Jaapia argillacea MUCL 33604]